MGIERVDNGIDDADTSELDRRPPPPPDKPGTDGYPARADSRKGAAEAQDTGEQPETVQETLETADSRPDSAERACAPDLRTSVWDEYPGDYDPPTASEESAIGDRPESFEHPASWIGDINPGYGDPDKDGRDVNCADCARAVERNWRGESQVAAALAPALTGEWNDRTEGWSGSRFEQVDFTGIERRLAAGGHGSSAMVGVDWRDGGGHYFNAVNVRGEILALDGQTGRMDGWPPSSSGLGYDASRVRLCEAIIRDRYGRDL